MIRPIAIGLAPNLEKKDALASLRFLVTPWSLLRGSNSEDLKKWIRKYFNTPYAFLFTSARGGITALLKSQGIGKGDEVLMQAFTCVAVSNAVLATGARPIYVDVTESFGVDIKDMRNKITQKTKVVILQHTFGIPAISDALLSLVKEKNLFLIEDAAHTIGGKYKGRKLGTFGDAGIFSLGRDKAFSSVSGGIVITKDKTIGEFLQKYQKEMGYPSRFWTFQQLFHSVSFYFFILPFYNLFLGKVLLVLLQSFHLLAKPVGKDELAHFEDFTKRLPNALCALVLVQLERIEQFNNHREKISASYAKELSFLGAKAYPHLPLLRYPLFIKNPKVVKQQAKKGGILLGDWYSHTIDPQDTNLAKVWYKKGSCASAENLAEHVLNLPTYPTLSSQDVQKIVKIVKDYAQS